MYSQQELDDAVAAGVMTPAAADAFRAYVERQRSSVIADEEQFRLLTGFNDIFVSIATVILLFAVGWIGQSIGGNLGLGIDDNGPSLLAPLAVAATSWGLALFFTGKRRMALPSILLLLAFVGGAALTTAFGLVSVIGPDAFDRTPELGGVVAAVAGIVGAAAAWLHWRTFRVPITIAAGTAAASAMVVGILVAILGERLENSRDLILGITLVLGIGVFLFAMWWDSSDRARITRRSDVAFWLHLLAAPMIIHPVFTLAWLERRQCDDRRGFRRHPALRGDRPHRAGDRSPRLARLGARLRALCPDRIVQAVRRGRAQRRADRSGDRLGTADAFGLLAPGAARRGRPPARSLAGQAADNRPAGGDASQPTTPA